MGVDAAPAPLVEVPDVFVAVEARVGVGESVDAGGWAVEDFDVPGFEVEAGLVVFL